MLLFGPHGYAAPSCLQIATLANCPSVLRAWHSAFAALGISVTQRLPLASCSDLRPTALSITWKCTALLPSLFTAPSQYLFSGFLLTDNVSYNISHNFSSLCVKLHIQELWKENQQVPGVLSLWGRRTSHHLRKQHRAIAPGEKKSLNTCSHFKTHLLWFSLNYLLSEKKALLTLSNFKRYYLRLIPEFLIFILTGKMILRIVFIQTIPGFEYCLLTTYRLRTVCLIIPLK